MFLQLVRLYKVPPHRNSQVFFWVEFLLSLLTQSIGFRSSGETLFLRQVVTVVLPDISWVVAVILLIWLSIPVELLFGYFSIIYKTKGIQKISFSVSVCFFFLWLWWSFPRTYLDRCFLVHMLGGPIVVCFYFVIISECLLVLIFSVFLIYRDGSLQPNFGQTW